VADAAVEGAGAAQFLASGGDGDQLADVARSTPVAFDAGDGLEQATDGVFAAEAGREDAGAQSSASTSIPESSPITQSGRFSIARPNQALT